MIRSMTGFGRSRVRMANGVVRAEVRSVNNRNLRTMCRLCDQLQGFEPELEKLVCSRLARGSVTLMLALDEFSGDPGFALDEAAMAHYYEKLAAVRDRLGLTAEITLDTLAALPGVVRRSTGAGEIPAALSQAALEATEQALEKLVANREEEGEHTWRDIAARCDAIARRVDAIEEKLPDVIAQYRRRVTARLEPLVAEVGAVLREEDIRKEVVFFAERADVCEEIARLRSHVALMKSVGDGEGPRGRRLEFIAQEMFREANTMGAKAGDGEIIPDVVELKADIEKIREQALNIE